MPLYIMIPLCVLGLFIIVLFGPYLCLPTIISLVIVVVSALLSHWTGISYNYLSAGFVALFIGYVWLYRRWTLRAGLRKIREYRAKRRG